MKPILHQFEGFAIENLLFQCPDWTPSFLRTATGAEVDLILSKGHKNIFFEMKLNSAPKISKGFYQLTNTLKPYKAFVIAPVPSSFTHKGIIHTNLDDLTYKL